MPAIAAETARSRIGQAVQIVVAHPAAVGVDAAQIPDVRDVGVVVVVVREVVHATTAGHPRRQLPRVLLQRVNDAVAVGELLQGSRIDLVRCKLRTGMTLPWFKQREALQ